MVREGRVSVLLSTGEPAQEAHNENSQAMLEKPLTHLNGRMMLNVLALPAVPVHTYVRYTCT